MTNRTHAALGLLLTTGLAGAASAQTQLTVTIENTQQQGGFFFTPFWIAAHNGGFDSYNGGQPAAGFPGITELAEDGLTGPISAAFAASAAGLAGGVDATLTAPGNGAPVFSPGESASVTLDIGDPTVNRYFSYASMLIPSNDLFVANGNPFAHEIFDAAGNFNGPFEILIFGRDLNDNGTEVNDITAGAAFSALGGMGIDEPSGTPVTNYFTLDPNGNYLHSIVGTTTVTGDTISRYIREGDLIARITVVPTPGTTAALGLAALAGVRRRRN